MDSNRSEAKEEYHTMMFLFVTHDDRLNVVNYLKSHPSELSSLFTKKANKENLKFSDNILKTIDLEMVRELCDKFAYQSPDEDIQTILSFFPKSNEKIAKDLLMKIANIQVDDSVLDVEFTYGDLIQSILDENKNQTIFGYDETILFDFVLLITYFKGATNMHLLHERISINKNFECDKVVSILPRFLNPDLQRNLYLDNLNDYSPEMFSPGSVLDLHSGYEYIELGMNQVKSDGQAFFALTTGEFQEESSIKRKMVENDWITAVVQLNWTLRNYDTIILVLDKSKKRNLKKVRMFNASDMNWSNKNNSEIATMEKRIIDAINKENNYSKFVRNVTLDEIIANDFNLLPADYLKDSTYDIPGDMTVRVYQNKLDGMKSVKLGDIADVSNNWFDTTSKNSMTEGRIVRNVNDGIFHLSDYSWVNFLDRKLDKKRFIKEKDILINGGFGNGAVSYVSHNYLNTGFNGVLIRLIDERFDSFWLAQYLRTPLVMWEYKNGDSFNELRVPLISIESQREMVNSYTKSMSAINETRQNLTEELNRSKIELYSEMGMSKFFKSKI
ncbi:N-6 DNA methylase [Companilactobacillus insicii]|uniref:N-6 DNA methylase n=1 Tax=Companilactobacillus insicii TaxID=1732567 RepID=UPI000F7B0FCB|nr:N-6 DNA methylase [Companilactobacillus insicii]